jgi:hypothetical protein
LVAEAYPRVRPAVLHTPLLRSDWLGSLAATAAAAAADHGHESQAAVQPAAGSGVVVGAAPGWNGPGCAGVWLKMESEQVTGSFKARGAVNKVHGAHDLSS